VRRVHFNCNCGAKHCNWNQKSKESVSLLSFGYFFGRGNHARCMTNIRYMAEYGYYIGVLLIFWGTCVCHMPRNCNRPEFCAEIVLSLGTQIYHNALYIPKNRGHSHCVILLNCILWGGTHFLFLYFATFYFFILYAS